MEAQLFCLSSGRCGSTLFQQMLNAAGCSINGEHGGFLAPIAKSYFTATTNDVIVRNLFGNALAWQNSFDREGLVEEYRKFVRGLFGGGGKYWGFKEIRYAGDVMEFLRALFPQSVFVFLVRNPVTNVASQVKAWDYGIQRAVDNWNQQNASFLAFRDGHLVRYEDFANPDSPVLSDLFGKLGLPMNDEVKRLQRTRVNGQKYEISEVLSEEDRAFILRETAELRSRLDY